MFIPDKIIIDEKAMDYEMGKKVFKEFKNTKTEIIIRKGGRVTELGKMAPFDAYKFGKKILVVGIRKESKFQSCKPSANYQLPLVSGCMGMCEYCYLQTQFGKRPYVKVYANIEDTLKQAAGYLDESPDEIMIFEGAATSDPIPIEPYTGILKTSIEFFANKENSKFRFVSKYNDVESFIGINHNRKTTIRFSINTNRVIGRYEHKTTTLEERIEAARMVSNSGYPIGFIIAPVFIYDGWEKEYSYLMHYIKAHLNNAYIKFEVISHRYTSRAKENILNVFPNTKLVFSEEERQFKYGQFGYGKYVYNKEKLKSIKEFFNNNLINLFGEESINYII
ncbi:spore photoproduct lyase [Clostridium sediminicola]|uniref:spore photoproduct lyase n=1 Tax=Clostridium sediminicola TaxID=3114879 RepID=UPI0031F2514F